MILMAVFEEVKGAILFITSQNIYKRFGIKIQQSSYSNFITTISGMLPTRIGGPQVPMPLEV